MVEARDLRVAILNPSLPPHRVPLYRHLAARVGRLKIIVSMPISPDRSWVADWRDLDVEVQRNIVLRRPWRHPYGFRDHTFLHLPLDTISRLRSYVPDVVITGGMGIRALQACSFRAEHPATRVVCWARVSEHTEHGREWARTRLRQWLVAQSDALLVNGASGRRYLEGLGADPASVFQVPYPVDTAGSSRRWPRQPTSPLRLLYVGQLTERKGLREFLDTLADWVSAHGEAVEWRVVGDGPLREPLLRTPLPKGLSLDLVGEVSPAEVRPFYEQADLFVFPTLADEWGLVVAEALAAGLPVLGSRHSQAVEELVVEDANGWVFSPRDRSETQGAIGRALSGGPEGLGAMHPACQRAVRHLSPDNVADRMLGAVLYATRRP